MGDEGSSSRPSMEFSVGLTLLLVMLLCMSGFFYCCYHWDKLRFILQPSVDETSGSQQDTGHNSPLKSTLKAEPTQGQNFTVLMPGDQLPKFVALPSPCKRKP